jgi:D-alanyl-D-alanine dipeptidase
MLIEITPEGYDLDLDLRYATADNITGRPIYGRAVCFLHMDAAALLGQAVALARPLGLRLCVFDGFRPAEAQRNRLLLLGLMTAADWDFYRNEWWHYQLFKPRGRYPVLSDAAAGTRLMPERPA